MTLIGRTLLSRYQVTQKIGVGGFGETYLAVDLALPGQPECVVKHLSPKDTSPHVLSVAQRLFEQEAQLLHRLGEHSQIPRLYAHFNDSGEFYLVQEFIEGKDLSHELQPGQPWSEEKTLKLLSEILEVLAVIHQQNVIHRDLKPTNIMRRKSDDKIVLIDFGAVKEIQGIAVNAQGQTHLTVGIGSPGYMPSEQAQGRPKLASDIYAVGIIGIQALTGLKPSQFPHDQKTDEILWRNHANVSDELAEILNKMVQERLSDRYSNASEALTSLTSLLTQSNNFSTANTHRLTTVNISQSAATTPISTPPFRQSVTQSIKSSLGGIITVIFFIGGVYVTIENLRSPEALLNADYTELQNLLEQRNWKEADIETEKVMLKMANREAEGWIDANTIESLSCSDLRELDQVWIKYSEGKFGLSIQKEIYLETGNPLGKFQESSYHKFGDRIGWRKNGNWLEYSDLTFDENAPRGQFPSCKNAAQKFSGCRWPLYWLFARAETCQL
ncbi:phosphotransferase enzyme family protein [Lyngbya aestuarii BL J]|uniref:non-specific serine/threonine protein kinase n=1 Tax=Lyngbya aestuarii BL J TaxID=1348334 RepID=U7QJB4_9CYAN|nr:serine/threonine-protein kinase [Lyngbya aestuarii]ERT06506.1 phosphotransferase enzyme family protein [Lyngbya aestuarii BL J]